MNRRRRIHRDRSAVADQVGELVGDQFLLARLPCETLGERLGSDRNSAPTNTPESTGAGEPIEVTPNRHLAHLERLGESGDLDPTFRPEQIEDLLVAVGR